MFVWMKVDSVFMTALLAFAKNKKNSCVHNMHTMSMKQSGLVCLV